MKCHTCDSQQAEKLAEALRPFAQQGRTQGHHPDESCCEYCDAHEALADYQAIKKEAENG